MAEKSVLLYDLSAAQPIGSSPVSGGGTYAKRVYRRLLSDVMGNRDSHWGVTGVACKGKAMDEELIRLSSEAGVEIHYVNDLRKELVLLIRKLSVDTFFSALPLRFKSLKFPPKVKIIYTIHGLRPLELLHDRYEPLFFYSPRSVLKYFVTRTVPRYYLKKRRDDFRQLIEMTENRHIITVSSYSRYALLAEFPALKEDEIETYYSPADERRETLDSSVLEELGLESGGYFLLICGNRWAKNPYRAVLALKSLAAKGLLTKKVLITGRGRASYLKKLEGHGLFITAGYLSREKLDALYMNAYAFIFPTLNEGFGYPPLECMGQGTPVITSPVNSLPELLEDSVLWADPRSVRELEARILWLLNDRDLYSELSEKGRIQEAKVRNRQKEDLDGLINCLMNPAPVPVVQ